MLGGKTDCLLFFCFDRLIYKAPVLGALRNYKNRFSCINSIIHARTYRRYIWWNDSHSVAIKRLCVFLLLPWNSQVLKYYHLNDKLNWWHVLEIKNPGSYSESPNPCFAHFSYSDLSRTTISTAWDVYAAQCAFMLSYSQDLTNLKTLPLFGHK